MPIPIKWTARSNKIVVYTGTLKNMQRYTGTAELFEKGILFGRGECLDGTRIGPWQFFHPCGALRSEVTFDSQGREEGVERYFYPDGRLQSIGQYRAGQPVGDWMEYGQQGGLTSCSEYSDSGERLCMYDYVAEDSSHLRRYMLFAANKMVLECWYHPDGSLWQQSRYENGQEISRWRPDYRC